MQLNHWEEANQFYEYVKPYLIQEEAYHNLIFGGIEGLRSRPETLTEKAYLVTVEDDDLVAVAIRTPPRNLLISRSLNFQAFNLIAQDLQARQELIPGVIGSVDEALSFAQTWQVITGQSYRLKWQLKIYQLTAVNPLLKAKGYFRVATQADYNLLISWCQEFNQEALGEAPETTKAQRIVENYLKNNNHYLWQDEVPVSVAGCSGLTPNGIRVNFVYTPPQYRGKGYASSCVAVLSQTLLDRGCKYCFLFADLAYATSNHIYQKIGYQAVGDMHEYLFEDSN